MHLLSTCFITLFALYSGPWNVYAADSTCPPSGCGPFGECKECDDLDPCTGERCKCDYGYVGHDCSTQVKYCDDTVHPTKEILTCWNGGTCSLETVDYQDSSPAQERYRCDCSTAAGDAAAYAGHQCEFEHAQSCIKNKAESDYAFCVNGGTCIDFVEPGQPHPGCRDCEGFEGRHCQYETGTAPRQELMAAAQNEANGSSSSSKKVSGFAWVVLILVIVGAVGVVAFVVMRRRRRPQEMSGSNDLELEQDSQQSNQDAQGIQMKEQDVVEDDIVVQTVAIDHQEDEPETKIV